MAKQKKDNKSNHEDARFYEIEGLKLPSVTSILNVFNKPALQYWYAKQQREKDAVIAATAKSGKAAAKLILENKRAADDAKTKAADIGGQAHAAIEWVLRKKLGLRVGEKPVLKGEARHCYEACRDWFRKERIEPIAVEKQVWSKPHGYAGTLDLYGKSADGLFLLDWKTGNRIYAEAYLQNAAYRHALENMGQPSEFGVIVRLPKGPGEPEIHTTEDHELFGSITFDDFLVALQAWKLWRRMEGKGVGGKA